MLDIQEVAVTHVSMTANGVNVGFGVYLPGIDAADGFQVIVRVIHKEDRFNPSIPPMDFPLQQVTGSAYNRWQTDQALLTPVPGTHFGQPGTYLYRYQLLRLEPSSGASRIVTRWFTDPFALKTDVGELSAFNTPGLEPDFVWTDADWRTPEIDDLIVYELHVEEFNSTFDGVVERLDYLRALGVNCLELMPVTSLKVDFDWGYGPLHYFAPNERWGGPAGLKRLIDACHAAGVAVILDVVYEHVAYDFAYARVYTDAGIPSPMIAGTGLFGPQIDFNSPLAHDYIRAANHHWLEEYHVDGFRYDEVTDLYDGPIGVKYARLAFEDYSDSFGFARFTPTGAAGEYSRIIQCPEALNRPQEILRSTYSNATWQDGLLGKAEDMASHGYVDDSFAHLLDRRFSGYPDTKTVQDSGGAPVERPVAPFQYLESHDHSQLISFVATLPGDVGFGDRGQFYKLQPFVIGLYTAQGIPMLWQGQEFAENWVLPNAGNGRICFRRDVNWEYFYDDYGSALIRLYRVLARLRRSYAALRSRESFYYNLDSRPADGLLAYRREAAALQQVAMVFLNFSDRSSSLSASFPHAGSYVELIDADVRAAAGAPPYAIEVGSAGDVREVQIPSNYGCVFVRA
jgi:maltooligosyltrehalose trehalohydrolase